MRAGSGPFTGTVRKVVFDLKSAVHEDEKALHEHAQVQAIGHGAAGQGPSVSVATGHC
jgi:hypothetical protein